MSLPLKTLLLLVALLLPQSASAQSAAVSEQALKAVLFYKLPLFAYTGSSARRSGVNICTLGDAPFGSAAEKLPATLADGRRVEFKALPSQAEIADCDFVFIGRSEAARIDALLERLQGRRVVTVSDIAGFAQAGGMVEFSLRSTGTGIQILINRKAAQRQGVEFNAQLLRLARIVEP
jgi:hypothetical protein